MGALAELPQPPLLRLRCSRTDVLRRVLERQPAWGHATASQHQQDGERGVTCYRLAAESFFVMVHWRWSGGQW